MAEKVFVLLLPTVLLIGTLMIYRSHPSVTNTRTLTSPQNISNESENLVQVEFFVMSKCPDAAICEALFLPSLFRISSIINFTLSFIAMKSSSKEIRCMHGWPECTGNKQQLCIQNMYSQRIFFNYLLCQSKQFWIIPENGEQCAKETSQDLIDWSAVQSCVTSKKSNRLFHQSLRRTRLASARKSCTIHLNGQLWCMHDGYWSNCAEGHDRKSFIRAICSRYHGRDIPIECTTSI